MVNWLINQGADKNLKIKDVTLDWLILSDSYIEDKIKARFDKNSTSAAAFFKPKDKSPIPQQKHELINSTVDDSLDKSTFNYQDY